MPRGVYTLARICYAHSHVYSQRGFLHYLFGTKGTSYDLYQRISNKRDPRFMIKEVYSRFRNLILYGIIGGFCAALDFGVY